jgi:hypothetical protein
LSSEVWVGFGPAEDVWPDLIKDAHGSVWSAECSLHSSELNVR